MHLKVINIDKVLFDHPIEYLIFPAIDGEYQILNNHDNIVSILKKGYLKVKTLINYDYNLNNDLFEFIQTNKTLYTCHIEGGVLHLNNNYISILL